MSRRPIPLAQPCERCGTIPALKFGAGRWFLQCLGMHCLSLGHGRSARGAVLHWNNLQANRRAVRAWRVKLQSQPWGGWGRV